MLLMETKASLFVQSCCKGDGHGSFTTHAGDICSFNIDNRKSDLSVKAVCYNGSEEHRPPKSLTMTREVNYISQVLNADFL
jgi:hypothetical protein